MTTPQEIKECRRQVARILARPGLSVGFQPLTRPHGRYYFSSEDGSRAEAGDRVYSVIPFYQSPDTKYWLGVTMDVAEGRDLNLLGVSLVMFTGNTSSEAKVPAFRAEWDRFDPALTNPHAQPHWHVYSLIDESGDNVNIEFSPELCVKEFNAKTSVDLKQFHFAMGAQWHIAGNTHSCQLDFANLSKWLDGCINYIRAQFEYLYT
jgi:hypothetical protein